MKTSDIFWIAFVALYALALVYEIFSKWASRSRKDDLQVSGFRKFLRRRSWKIIRADLKSLVYGMQSNSNYQAVSLLIYDLNYDGQFKDEYLNLGYDRVRLSVLARLEKIRSFVHHWRGSGITGVEEMLQVYLTEGLPENQSK